MSKEPRIDELRISGGGASDVVEGGETRAVRIEYPLARVAGDAAAAPWSVVAELLAGEGARAVIGQQRWSGARGGGLGALRVSSLTVLPLPAPSALAVLAADLNGSPVRYLLPLVRRPLRAAPPALGNPLALIVGESGREGVFDAVHDAEFRAAFGEAVQRGAVFEGGGARYALQTVTALSALTPRRSRVLGAEQSNSSIVYDERAILKLYRRLSPGVQPDVEIGRYLGGPARFAHSPALLGTVTLADSLGTSVAGMLQEYVAGALDGWAHAVAGARADVAGEAAESAAGGAAGNAPPPGFAAPAARLGVVTRALHDALAANQADPAFAPEPATAGDVERWVAGTQRSIERGLAALERALADGAVRGPLADEAANMIAWRDAFLERAAAAAALVGDDAGLRIRHHGDYHLGQLLVTPAGDYAVIDFEGEPIRPLDERRAKHSALRDVAGMLRSFGYAAATAGAEQTPGGVGAEPGHAPDPRFTRWEAAVRRAFVRGYVTSGVGPRAPYLPTVPQRADALITLFETEKVFYELAYELQNRPEWVWIPLLGTAQLLAR